MCHIPQLLFSHCPTAALLPLQAFLDESRSSDYKALEAFANEANRLPGVCACVWAYAELNRTQY